MFYQPGRHVLLLALALVLTLFASHISLAQVSIATAEEESVPDAIAPLPLGSLIISEFRLKGPGVGTVTTEDNDEFIEIFNTTSAPITVATADASPGYSVRASDGLIRCTIPNGTVIPAHGHYLCVNSLGYSLPAYPAGNGTPSTGDATYTTNIPNNAGIALFRSATSTALADRLDAVGSTSEANTLYREGAGYPAITPFSIDYSFVRRLPGGCTGTGGGGNCNSVSAVINTPPPSSVYPQDTDDNAADFIFIDTKGTPAGAGERLGTPGPENLSSPIVRGGQTNGTIQTSLFAPCRSSADDPNRVRDMTQDSANNSIFGTLDIRKRFTNTTGGHVTRLRFRIVDMTTFLPVTDVADLRARSSNSLVVPNPCTGTSATVLGTTLEQATPTQHPNGGGYNSTLSASSITLGSSLANGDSVDLRFLLGVQQQGKFRFFVIIEALP